MVILSIVQERWKPKRLMKMPPLYKTNITTITTAVTAAVVAADFKEKTQYRNA